MSETSNPSTAQPQPPQEFHWGISYLREDIQDLRQEFRSVHTRIDGTNQHIDEKYELLNRRLDSQFRWFMTTIVTIGGVLVALSGVIISALKF